MDYVEKLIMQQSGSYNPVPLKWEHLIPFDGKALPEFNANVFSDWLKEYVEGVAEVTQTPIDAAGIAAISTLSTILAKRGYVDVLGNDSWKEPLNTYAILALPPGNRKSSVFRMLTKPIEIYEQEECARLTPKVKTQQVMLKAKRTRLEKLNKDYANKGEAKVLKDIEILSEEIDAEEIIVLPRFVTSDVTVEKLGMLMGENNEKMAILSAEGAGALSSIAGRYDKNSSDASMNLYLEAHPGDSVTIDRVGRESIHLSEPTLTIGLFIQPETVRNLPPSFNDRGLMQRFLYSFPISLVGNREITPNPIEKCVKDEYFFKMDRLLRFEPTSSIRLTLSKTAAQAEIKNREEIEIMLRDEGELGGMKEWGSKLAGQIIRIAGLFHFVENVDQLFNIPGEINLKTFESARKLQSYFIGHAKEAYGIMDSLDDEKDAKYILKRITEKFIGEDKVVHQELWQLVKRKYKKVEVLNKILDQLEARNFIRNVKEGKKRVIVINPTLINTQNNTPNSPNENTNQQAKRIVLGTRKILGVPNYPNDEPKTISIKSFRGELEALGTTRGNIYPNKKSIKSKVEFNLGALGGHSNGIEIKVNEDGSGLL